MWQVQASKAFAKGDQQGRCMWQDSLVDPRRRNRGVRHQKLVRLHNDEPKVLVLLAEQLHKGRDVGGVSACQV